MPEATGNLEPTHGSERPRDRNGHGQADKLVNSKRQKPIIPQKLHTEEVFVNSAGWTIFIDAVLTDDFPFISFMTCPGAKSRWSAGPHGAKDAAVHTEEILHVWRAGHPARGLQGFKRSYSGYVCECNIDLTVDTFFFGTVAHLSFAA